MIRPLLLALAFAASPATAAAPLTAASGSVAMLPVAVGLTGSADLRRPAAPPVATHGAPQKAQTPITCL